MEAQLTPEVIEDCKLRPALLRLGKALAKQRGGGKFRDSGKTVVGVELLTIGFVMVTSHEDKT